MSNPFLGVNTALIRDMEAYLHDRGLEIADVAPHINIFPHIMTRELGRDYYVPHALGRDFMIIDYLGPDGKTYVEGPSEKVYAIMRFVGEPKFAPPPGKKPIKVISQIGRGLELHFEPIKGDDETNWLNLPSNIPIIICESRMKATCIHKHTGVPSIGLGGVWTWSSKRPGDRGNILSKYGVDLSNNPVIIVFDSNLDNPDVTGARDALMFNLRHELMFQDISYVNLPKTEEGLNQGPDDFIVRYGAESFLRLIEGRAKYEGHPTDGLVDRMNEVAVFDLQTGGVIDRGDKLLRKRSHSKDVYANINEQKLNKNKTVTVTQGFDVWLQHKSRNEVDGVKYRYLGDEYVVERRGDEDMKFYNMYKKDGLWPVEGGHLSDDAKFWIDCYYKIAGEKAELLRSYVRYLKFEQGKPTSFFVLYSDKRGVGKGLFTSTMEKIIGKRHSRSVRATDFVTNFTGPLAFRRLIIVNEFSVPNEKVKKQAMDTLKTFIGDEEFTIEYKGLNSFTTENTAGILITCNELSDIPNDGMEDRRMAFVNFDGGATLTEADWTRLHDIRDNNEVVLREIAAWLYEAAVIDFATWRPPLDESKVEAIKASVNDDLYAYMTAREDLVRRGAKATTVPRIDLLAGPYMRAGRLEDLAAKTKGKLIKEAGFTKTEFRTAGKNGVGQTYIYLLGDEQPADESIARGWVDDTNDLFKGG